MCHGPSRGSPVQEHELLLVGIPTQARADLQSVVVVGVEPGATTGQTGPKVTEGHTHWDLRLLAQAHLFSASKKILTDWPLMSTTSRMTMMSYRDTICRGPSGFCVVCATVWWSFSFCLFYFCQ